MSLLTDWQIRNLCLDLAPGQRPLLTPFVPATSGAGRVSYGCTHAGYDLRLGQEIVLFKNIFGEVLDVRLFNDPAWQERVYETVTLEPGGSFLLPGHCYVLGHSMEYLC